jgi:UDP-2,4-diacetamido-2,4,6-trideoxy-beta-L-altropyranose hydrolase
MLKTVLQKGYAVRELSAPATEWCQKVNSDYVLSHAHWLGVTSQSDVADTQQALQGEGMIDWLVVDHYALDAKWEQAMQAMSRNLMVIDDLADRQHYCDLLLDQNLGRTEQDYASLMSKQAKLLIGPSFALLRHEFATARYDSLVRRQQPALTHLLVSMGGIDKDNLTGRVLDALAQSGMQPGFKITVVMGEHAP